MGETRIDIFGEGGNKGRNAGQVLCLWVFLYRVLILLPCCSSGLENDGGLAVQKHITKKKG